MNPIPKAPRLYPVLSDIESTTCTESDHNDVQSEAEQYEHRRLSHENNRHHNDSYCNDDEEDRWAKLFECILFCFCIE